MKKHKYIKDINIIKNKNVYLDYFLLYILSVFKFYH